MPSISSYLSNKELDLPEVEVLLATFNGELYLSEFLDSLVQQQGVKIHLRVSDDGSADGTLNIIDSYKNKFASCQVYNGPQNGPSANFFSLIEKATYEFVALADQDDIWLPNHLLLSLNRLAEDTNSPSITFSAVTEFGEKLKYETIWPSRFPGEDIKSILTENPARGCTFVLNQKAVKLICLHKPMSAVMHDWWILLLLYTSGKVSWSEIPEVKYRIHSYNVIGGKHSFSIRLSKYINSLKNGDWKIVSQAEELLTRYGELMSIHKRLQLLSFLREFSSPLSTGRLNLVLWPRRFRAGINDEIAVRLHIICSRPKKRG